MALRRGRLVLLILRLCTLRLRFHNSLTPGNCQTNPGDLLNHPLQTRSLFIMRTRRAMTGLERPVGFGSSVGSISKTD